MPLAQVKEAIKANLEAKALENQLTETLTKQKTNMNVKINDFK